MALASWWSTDPFPRLPALDGFHATVATDEIALAQLNNVSVLEVQNRRRADHRPYLGTIHGRPAAYGWVATREASIGELGLTFTLPAGNRYLWDFATAPEWQGRGIYPQLLRAILLREWPSATRFWIIHAPENLPSGAGMHKAGFAPVGRLSFGADGGVALAPLGALERARAGAALLGVPLAETALSPCWRCGERHETESASGCSCWPPNAAHAHGCSCAIRLRPPFVPIS